MLFLHFFGNWVGFSATKIKSRSEIPIGDENSSSCPWNHLQQSVKVFRAIDEPSRMYVPSLRRKARVRLIRHSDISADHFDPLLHFVSIRGIQVSCKSWCCKIEPIRRAHSNRRAHER